MQWLQPFKLSEPTILDVYVYIVAQKRLGNRSEPSYNYFSELMLRVSGGARRPQLTQLMPRPVFRSGVDRNFWLNANAYYSSR